MMLAQIENVAPSALRDFALIVGGAAATAYYVKEIFWNGGNRRDIYPDPLRVQKMEKFVSEKDCASRHAEETARMSQLHQQLIAMEASRETQRRQVSEDLKTIYNHIDEVRRELSQKIEDMPDRVIATLKNT